MSEIGERRLLSPVDLHLPNSPIPRLGDHVVWYSDAHRRQGILVGHGPTGGPIVRGAEGFTDTLRDFDEIRWSDQGRRNGPMWERMPNGIIVRPLPDETSKFNEMLGRRLPPGPSYFEVVEEIWHRGFEVFLVGGSVRDVIAGGRAKDVDLVTSMPIQKAVPMLTRMFRNEPSIDGRNGFVRLGGKPGDGDPHIDLKSFVYKEPGTEYAVFASDFERDVRHRDFACNAVYFDPINNALLDPSGTGIISATESQLHLVCDSQIRTPYQCATVVIRLAKFRARGFTVTERTIEVIQTEFIPHLATMTNVNLLSYIKRQILNKASVEERPALLEALATAFREVGAGTIWEERIQPVLLGNRMIRGEE